MYTHKMINIKYEAINFGQKFNKYIFFKVNKDIFNDA